jgi:hypothetical protein
MTFVPAGSRPEITGTLLRGRLQRHIIDSPVDTASGLPVVLTGLTLEIRALGTVAGVDGPQLLAPVSGEEDSALSALYTTRRGRPAAIYVVQFTPPLTLPDEVLLIERWAISGVPDSRRTRVSVTGV